MPSNHRTPHDRYVDFIHADTGLTFAEYLGINAPTFDWRPHDGLYRCYVLKDGSFIEGRGKTKKEAKENYKAALRAKQKEWREYANA